MGKKIDDQELLRLHRCGMTNTAIAQELGCSKQYVGRKLTYLKSLELPESFEKLTEKQKAFALARAGGMTKTDAAMKAYDCQDRKSAKVLGHKMEKEVDLNTAIADLLAQENIGRRVRVQQLKRLIMAKTDLNAVARGLDLANKMVGEYVSEKGNQEIDVNILFTLVNDELPKLQAQIEAYEAEMAAGAANPGSVLPEK